MAGRREAADGGLLEGLRKVPERGAQSAERRLCLGPGQSRAEASGE